MQDRPATVPAVVSSVDRTDVAALVRDADAAVAEGRAVDAIDRLTEANRARRDATLERRLVELRHDAFTTWDRTPGRPEWPRRLPDPFPGEEGIPSAPVSQLTGDLLGGALVHHGCLRVDALLGPDDVANLVGRIDAAFAARARLAEGAPLEAAAPWFVPFEPGRNKAEGFGHQAFVRTVDAPGALFDLAELFDRTGVRAAVTDYFAERPAMIANKWVLRRTTGGKLGTDYHQDGAFLGEGIRTVDCWIALTDCGPGTGNPAMDLVPRRFEVLESGEGAAFRWSLSEDAVAAAAPGAPVVSPTFAAGDALFFDERLPHRTSVGTDLGTRHAVESWFVAPSSYPAKHEPVVL